MAFTYKYEIKGLTPAGEEKMALIGKRFRAGNTPTTHADDEDAARKRFATQVNAVFGSDLLPEDVVLTGKFRKVKL